MVSPKFCVTLLLAVAFAAAVNLDAGSVNSTTVHQAGLNKSAEIKKINIQSSTSEFMPEPPITVKPNVTTTVPPKTTTVSPNTTTVPTTTTVLPNTTTVLPNTTTVSPNTTTVSPITTTLAPNTTTVAPSPQPPTPGRGFDAPSFFGGLALGFSIMVIVYVAYRYFNRGGGYHTL